MQQKKSSLSKKKLFNKYHTILAVFLMVLCMISITVGFSMRNFALDSYALSPNQFSKSLAASPSEWSFEKSGSVEKITQTASGWVMQAGGNTASTHYARTKYKLPEKAGIAPTRFYMKAEINLPADFYSKQKAGFRIMNTDNFLTTLNGTPVGSVNANEFRTSVYMNSDHSLRIKSQHDQNPAIEFFKLNTQLPVGDHILELSGDVANVVPWYFKLDGNIVASGINRMSPDSVPANERVITRMVAGIDGAASQDSNSVTLTVKNFEISDYDPNSTNNPTATPTPITNTDTTAPTISITSPINNARISKSVSIKTSASDSNGIKKIEILFDGKIIKTCNSTSSCRYTYNSKSASSGNHSIVVNAYDKSSNSNLATTTLSVTK
jgi:hypothetical protein